MNLEYEMGKLQRKTSEVYGRVEAVLKKTLGDERDLSWLKADDRRRLLVLTVWEERHHYPLEDTVALLLSYYATIKTGGRHKRFGNGLPVRAATLVSRKSEQVLIKYLQETFPNGEHVDIWRQRRLEWAMAEEMSKTETEMVIPEESKFESLHDFMESYERWMEERRKLKGRLLMVLRNSRPYRDNPWRQA